MIMSKIKEILEKKKIDQTWLAEKTEMTTKIKDRYNSDINILGSIPDYGLIIASVATEFSQNDADVRHFSFRTSKTMPRFQAAIRNNFFQFKNENHQTLFRDAMVSEQLSQASKLLLLFWQLIYSNALFADITKDVFFHYFYAGRISLVKDDILVYLNSLKSTSLNVQGWSTQTIEIIASKYLTILKKLGLAEGGIRKEIVHPYMEDALFVYFIRLLMITHSEKHIVRHPDLLYGFMAESQLMARLKRISNQAYWNINQIGNELTIELKNYEL